MISIKIKKGYDINIQEKQSCKSEKIENPLHVAVLPEKIPFIKPRLLTDTGKKVKIGSVLFEDKRNPDIKFLSPGGGEIAEINFGPRRVIREIVIKLDNKEEFEQFEAISEKELENIDRERLIKHLLKGGIWNLIKELPFRDIAKINNIPPAIFVNLDCKEPFHPEPEVYLKEKKDLFIYGIKALNRLAKKVFISVSFNNDFVLKEFDSYITHTYKGDYPADDPGVLLYHIKKSSSENKAWYINGQDLSALAYFLKTGKYPVQRTVAVGQSVTKQKKHFETRLGVPLSHLTKDFVLNENTRYIVGGIFRGYTASKESYMSFYETSLTLIPEGNEKEFLGFAKPGMNKPSYSKAFLSVFNPSETLINCNIHGDERACINCGTCAKVCPVDIFPQFAFKAVLAKEKEESLELGILDCVECGLCTYVCPSKIEICDMIKNAKIRYYNE